MPADYRTPANLTLSRSVSTLVLKNNWRINDISSNRSQKWPKIGKIACFGPFLGSRFEESSETMSKKFFFEKRSQVAPQCCIFGVPWLTLFLRRIFLFEISKIDPLDPLKNTRFDPNRDLVLVVLLGAVPRWGEIFGVFSSISMI